MNIARAFFPARQPNINARRTAATPTRQSPQYVHRRQRNETADSAIMYGRRRRPMLRDCPAHGIWIETRMTGVSAHDDFVNVTSIATSTACQLECRIRREDCQGLLQTHPPRVPGGHEAIHATVDLDAVDSMPSGNTLRPESSEFWQSPSLATGWPLEIDVSM